MKLLGITPMLWTAHLKETVEFYTKTLGFTCGEFNESWGWAAMHRDNVEIMIAVPNKHTPFDKPAFTGTLYIRLDGNIDELWEKLNNKVKICYPINDFEYGMRDFAIYDNNGYTIQFGQEIKTS